MANRWRRLIERMLPWYSPLVERQRDRRTEAIRQRSIASRIKAERVIDDYRKAEAAAHVQGKRLIQEVRRAEDR